MGLIMAAIGAAAGTMADQWKEYFYCEALPDDEMVGWHHRLDGHEVVSIGS